MATGIYSETIGEMDGLGSPGTCAPICDDNLSIEVAFLGVLSWPTIRPTLPSDACQKSIS